MALHALLRSYVLKRNPAERPTNPAGNYDSAGLLGWLRAEPFEPRFIAHRHWNLADSMFYSEYVASRLLELGPAGGADTIASRRDRLLAKAGIELRTCKQEFVHMTEDDRNHFFARMRNFAASSGGMASFRLTPDLFYPSFAQSRDMDLEWGAADVVYAMQGHLSSGGAAPSNLARMREALMGGAPRGNSPGAPVGDGVGAAVVAAWEGKSWLYGFNDAFNCLSVRVAGAHKAKRLLENGLQYYTQLRKAVARLSVPILEKGTHRIVTGAHFVWLSLDEELTDSDRAVFSQPLPLLTLARYVVTMHRGGGEDASTDKWALKWPKYGSSVEPAALRGTRKPLLLSVRHPVSSSDEVPFWTVCALGVPEGVGEGGYIRTVDFQGRLVEAAEAVGATFQLDAFDAASLIIAGDKKAFFIEALDPKLRE